MIHHKGCQAVFSKQQRHSVAALTTRMNLLAPFGITSLSRLPLLLILSVAPSRPTSDGRQDGRVINGTAVYPPHKYPWTISLYFAGCFSDGVCPRPRHSCGGSIINEHFVLTAAHCCFLDPKDTVNVSIKGLFVLTGIYEHEKLESWSQNLSIAECIPHELYAPKSLLHDIALIRVHGRIQFGDKVTPTNIPSPDLDVEADGQYKVILAGWGNTNPTAVVLPKELREVTLPIVTTDTCQRTYSFIKFYGKNTSFIVTDNMLCAGFPQGNATGGCVGDSGSPLLLLNPTTKTYTQVGIVSWGLLPCASSFSVFTSLSKYVHWIEYHLQKCRPRTLVT